MPGVCPHRGFKLTLLSLALTTPDATRAPAGIAVNLAILVALWLAPQLAGRLVH